MNTMSTNIEKISRINKEKLNGEFYFQSLLEEAYAFRMISDADIERIQYECLELLANKTKRYNRGESSSIPTEVAKNIMKSNLYTIGLYLKSYPTPDDAVKALKESKVAVLYSNGRNLIDTMLKNSKEIYSNVINNLIEIENFFYNETLEEEIKVFFNTYNPDFSAHEIPITPNYPIYNPVKELVGIEFIQSYLESLYYENTFCNNFLSDDLHHLLCGVDREYQELLFNIYEPVLATAIGCILSGENIHRLSMTEPTLSYLDNQLKDKSIDEVTEILLKAFDKNKNMFLLISDSQEQYLKTSLRKIAYDVLTARDLNTLNKVFIIARYPEEDSKIYFSYGDKMDDEQYRKIVEEIVQCRYLSDKIAIIKEQIHTLADFEDILLDAELSADEMMSLLHELEFIEIIALAKKYPFEKIEVIEISEKERLISKCIHELISLLPGEQQIQVSRMIDALEIND